MYFASSLVIVDFLKMIKREISPFSHRLPSCVSGTVHEFKSFIAEVDPTVTDNKWYQNLTRFSMITTCSVLGGTLTPYSIFSVIQVDSTKQ
jgi:hypothetical protein